MHGFWKCFAYMSIVSFASFLFGRLLPKKWFNYEKFPYRQFDFEKSGRLYCILKVKHWKGKVLDMSVMFKAIMPSKSIPEKIDAKHAEVMLRETCVAEWTHYFLMPFGIPCIFLWEALGGWIWCICFAVGNIPFVIIQRYNRPKLLSLYKRLKSKEENKLKARG